MYLFVQLDLTFQPHLEFKLQLSGLIEGQWLSITL